MRTPDRNVTHGLRIAAPCDGAALSLHAPHDSLPQHEHPSAYVCVVLAGAFVESGLNLELERRAGDIVFHPPGERHADQFGAAGARCLNLDVHVARPAVRRASATFRVAAQTLAEQAALGPEGDRLCAESALAEIVSELRDKLREERQVSPARGKGPVDRVAEALDDQPERPWTLEELARIANRHPTHLARAFRNTVGVSIGEYRRRKRLVALSLNLRCTSDALGDLALAHGYADQAHMTREFRRFAGCSPGAWRRHFR